LRFVLAGVRTLLYQHELGEAVDAVRAWREQGEVPFPDFSPERKASMRGAIEYPPRDSALRNGVVGP